MGISNMSVKTPRFALVIIGLTALNIYVLHLLAISQDKDNLEQLSDPFSDGDHPVRYDNNITVSFPFPKVADKFMVYKVEHPVIDEKWVEEFAKKQIGRA